MSWFAPRFNGSKLKVQLKLCTSRLQMLQKKKENLGVLARKDIAGLLKKNKEELARIRVEQVIREDYIGEVLEILELYCSLLTSRFGLIEQKKDCDAGLREAVCTLLWITPHLAAEVQELKAIAAALGARYGKDFVREAMTNTGEVVSMRVIKKMECQQPAGEIVDGYLIEIAATYGVEYIPPHRGYPGDAGSPPPPPGGELVDLPPVAGGHLMNTEVPTSGGPLMFPNPPGHAGPSSHLQGLFDRFPVAPGAPPAGGAAAPGAPPALYPPEQPLYPPQQPSSGFPPQHPAPGPAPGGPPNIGMFPQAPGTGPAGAADLPSPPGAFDPIGVPEKGPAGELPSAPPADPNVPPPQYSDYGPPPPAASGPAPEAPPAVPDFDDLSRRFNALRSSRPE